MSGFGIEHVDDAIDASLARAKESGTLRFVCIERVAAGQDLLDRFVTSDRRDAFYWEEPAREFAILALGRAAAVEDAGPGRFGRAAEASRALHARCDGAPPHLVGGFAFSAREVDPASEWAGLGAGRLLLPEISFVKRGEAIALTVCCAVEPNDKRSEIRARMESLIERAEREAHVAPDFTSHAAPGNLDDAREHGPEIRVRADRPHPRYIEQVEAALEAIGAGKVEKVVLARSLEVHANGDFDRRHFFAALRTLYPSCALAIVREGEDTFVSATPERLVRLIDDRVETTAVAGSAARGRNPDEEARLGGELLSSEKEREEHEVVKRSIRSALHDLCGELVGPDEPGLLKLEGIQHLETPLQGVLQGAAASKVHVLDLVERLHPTPAVAGAPRAAALDWLERFEDLDRGWYAGPIGYVDARGRGEFRVALRSARLGARDARLFAGAGIVRGSEPERELAETRLKLRALLAPLTEI